MLVATAAACRGGSSNIIAPPGNYGGGAFAWRGLAKDDQHWAQAAVAAQPLARIHWQTPVDLNPQYPQGELLAHYGSPIITQTGTVIIGVKTGATDGFRVEAHGALSGALIWQAVTDYSLPMHGWIPSFGPSLTPGNRLYFAGSGGKLFYRDNPDSAQGTIQVAVFYGLAQYNAAKSTFDAYVKINTPITTDGQGNAYFGFVVSGPTPNSLVSGIARVGANGQGSWVSAATAAGSGAMAQIPTNCAPALSPDRSTVYVAVSSGYNGYGYLVGLDSTTLQTKYKAALLDPQSGSSATISSDGTASPTIGPDGDVYYGVLETSLGNHNYRGWLLHFNATLSQTKLPGSFGWDDTASVAPASMVPSYTGSSAYLLMTKYNNYAGAGTGDGQNKIAILDPAAPENDPISGIPVMKETLTILGVTPDPLHPGGVREWCINTAAVDPTARSVFANSEDGYLYRWDLTTNTFAERIQLTGGIAESYTPTALGPDGQVYAVNNAVLFAVGQ